MDNRGVTPVVEKLLTIGIVVLFIGSTTAVLYGSAVPEYRDSVGAELSDRIVVSAAEQIESAVPPQSMDSTGTVRLDLPRTIRGEPYALRTNGNTLVLDHPRPSISAEARLSVPARGDSVSGGTGSRGEAIVRFTQQSGGVAIRLGGDS